MSKRFTETAKWEDSWFRKLPVAYKALWEFLRDRCDNAGVWKKDIELASFFIGAEIKEEEALKFLNEGKERVRPLNAHAWFLMDFIGFQYGELSEKCPPHKQIIALIQTYIDKGFNIPFSYPYVRVQDKDKDKDKEKDKEKKGGVGENKHDENFFELIAEEMAEAPGKRQVKPQAEAPGKSRGKTTNDTNHEVKIFIDFAFESFKAKTGEKLCVDGKKDGAIVKNLLSTYDLDKLKELWDVFMQSDDDPFIQTAGFSIGVFKSQINKLVSKKTRKQGDSDARFGFLKGNQKA